MGTRDIKLSPLTKNKHIFNVKTRNGVTLQAGHYRRDITGGSLIISSCFQRQMISAGHKQGVW
jgi:hypothetical protein